MARAARTDWESARWDAGVEGEPLSCPLFQVDPDDLLAWMADLEAESRRRGACARPRSSPQTRAPRGRDTHPPPKVELILYTSAVSEKSHRALRAIQEVLKDYEPGQVRLSTCDLSINPQDAEADSVVFTPTLVKQGPGPRTAIIGNLEDREVLRDLLDASGVTRRWDD